MCFREKFHCIFFTNVCLVQVLIVTAHDPPHVQLSEEELETMKEQLSIWKKLRHDLERVRMLAELSRRREKQKKELVSVLNACVGHVCVPFTDSQRPFLLISEHSQHKVHTYVHTYVRTYVYVYIHVSVHTYVRITHAHVWLNNCIIYMDVHRQCPH